MHQLLFSQMADGALGQIEADAGRQRTVQLVWDLLDQLAAEPTGSRFNQRLYRIDGESLAGFTFEGERTEWLVLWGRHGDEALMIHYLGPDL